METIKVKPTVHLENKILFYIVFSTKITHDIIYTVYSGIGLYEMFSLEYTKLPFLSSTWVLGKGFAHK